MDRRKDALYTPAEVARFLGVPPSTVTRWSDPGNSFVTRIDSRRQAPSIPFVGFAEAYALRALRQHGVPLQRIRPALRALAKELGVSNALASQRLATDGAEVLYNYQGVAEDGTDDQLVVVRHNQPVFADAVQDLLKQIRYEDGYAASLPLIGYPGADLRVDSNIAFGRPVFRSGARLEDAIGLFVAGEPLDVVAREYDLSVEALQAAIRPSLKSAA